MSDDTSNSFSGLTEREIAELFYAIPKIYQPSREHWTILPQAAEVLSGDCPCGYCAWLREPEPAPIPRDEEFPAWVKRTAALLEECAERRQ